MGWATQYIAKLKAGETVQFRPRGHSMSGRIESGQLVTVEPVSDPKTLLVDEIVLCAVNGNHFLHIIKGKRGAQFLIGNNRGRINGWTSTIYGRLTTIAP